MKKYTYSAKSSDNPGNWFVVDAQVAARLRGKHSPLFTPHADMGDHIIVVNAEKVKLTGAKWQQKTYYRHTGYIGGIKSINAQKLKAEKPENLLRFAVRGMLPKNRLGRKLFKKLKVYGGNDHPHAAQQPETLELR